MNEQNDFETMKQKALIDAFLAHMRKKSWSIDLQKVASNELPEDIRNRYINAPELWIEFSGCIREMVCPDETAWFLGIEDFDGQTHTGWHWNEWELLSREAAEGDSEWEKSIVEFWDNHLPIFMSVRGGYSYYAISMKDGSIVQGNEPEFEECELVASSFSDFLKKVMRDDLQL